MSYDVSLLSRATGDVLEMAEPFVDGGTYAVGGTTECYLNITYNYSRVYGTLVRDLDGKGVHETIADLRAFVAQYQDELPDRDYWAPTPGNAAKAIRRLLSFATAHPDGVWRVG